MEGYVVFIPLRGFALTLVIVPGSTGISLLYEFLQLPFSYERFYLLFQVSAVLCLMFVILMETAVFSLVTHVGRRVQ